MDKEIQYIPVGRVRRRRRTWRRTMRDLVRMLMAGGELIGRQESWPGAGFGVGLVSSDEFSLERGIQDEGQIPSGKN